MVLFGTAPHCPTRLSGPARHRTVRHDTAPSDGRRVDLSSFQRCARQHCVSWLRCSRQHRRRIESDTGRCHFAACRHRQRTASPYANQLAPLFVDNENSSAIAAVEISCGRHRRKPTQLAPYTPEAENPGRVRSPGRHPIPTRSPPLLVCRHQNRGNASAVVIDAWLSAATATSRPARLQHRRRPRC